MKCILRIYRHAGLDQKLTAEFIGGPCITYTAKVLSAFVLPNGKRAALNLPGSTAYGHDAKQLEKRALAHLKNFGFERADITIEKREWALTTV